VPLPSSTRLLSPQPLDLAARDHAQLWISPALDPSGLLFGVLAALDWSVALTCPRARARGKTGGQRQDKDAAEQEAGGEPGEKRIMRIIRHFGDFVSGRDRAG